MVFQKDGGEVFQYTFTTRKEEIVDSIEELCDEYEWSESAAITYLLSKGIEAELGKEINTDD